MNTNNPLSHWGLSLAVAISACVGAATARGQSMPGVTDKEILIGSCSALQGPSRALGVETVTGAKTYFSMVNDTGGVNGRKLKLIAYDDSYDPAKTDVCFNRLMKGLPSTPDNCLI